MSLFHELQAGLHDYAAEVREALNPVWENETWVHTWLASDPDYQRRLALAGDADELADEAGARKPTKWAPATERHHELPAATERAGDLPALFFSQILALLLGRAGGAPVRLSPGPAPARPPAHRRRDRGQLTQPVDPHRLVVGHHQHVVEVAVDWPAAAPPARPAPRRSGCASTAGRDPAGRLLPGGEQRRLGVDLEQRRRHSALRPRAASTAASAGSFFARFEGRVNTVTRSSHSAPDPELVQRRQRAPADPGSRARSEARRPPCRAPPRRR